MYFQSKGYKAEFTTRPLVFFEPQVTVNARAPTGEVRFEICNEKNQPVEGYTFEDCWPHDSPTLSDFNSSDQTEKNSASWSTNACESPCDSTMRGSIRFAVTTISSMLSICAASMTGCQSTRSGSGPISQSIGRTTRK